MIKITLHIREISRRKGDILRQGDILGQVEHIDATPFEEQMRDMIQDCINKVAKELYGEDNVVQTVHDMRTPKSPPKPSVN